MQLPVILSLRGPRARGIQFMSKALSFEIPATMDSSEVETIELISSVGEEPETVTAVSSRYGSRQKRAAGKGTSSYQRRLSSIYM